MSIIVWLPSFVREFTGENSRVEAKGQSLGEVLNDLMAKYPALKAKICDQKGKLLPYFNIYINDETTSQRGPSHPVNDGDEVFIVPAMGRG